MREDHTALPRLFCFCVALTWGYEAQLVKAQYKARTSIFDCDDWAVFSMESMLLAPGVATKAIPGASGVWKRLPGTDVKILFNTNVFLRAWGAIREGGLHRNSDWVAKSDVDAVFFPGRLRRRLGSREWSWTMRWDAAVYVKNCWRFDSMQGPLEVMSRAAVDRFNDQLGRCTERLPYESLGEDQFMDKCLHTLGVQSVDAFDMLKDFYCHTLPSACACPRPDSKAITIHPCKSVDSYFDCLKNVTAS